MFKPEHRKLIQLVTPYCKPGISTIFGEVNCDNTITLTIKGIFMHYDHFGELYTKIDELGGELCSYITEEDLIYFAKLTK